MNTAMRRALFGRSLFLQSCWNYERMQNIGFAYAIDPWLKRCYGEGAPLSLARARHFDFFNTQPYMSGLILGLVCALEEDAAAKPSDEAVVSRIRALKTASASALAGIGDALFWATLRPLCAALAILLAALAWPRLRAEAILLGTLAYLAAFNAPAAYLRWKGLAWGYSWKEQIGVKLKSFPWQRWIGRLRLAGLGFTAAAAAAWYAAVPARSLLEPSALVVFLTAKTALSSASTGRLYAGAVALGCLASFAGWL